MKFKTLGQANRDRRRKKDKTHGKTKAKIETQRIEKEKLFEAICSGAFIGR